MQRPQGIRAAVGWVIAEGCAMALAASAAHVGIVIAHDILRLVPLTTSGRDDDICAGQAGRPGISADLT